MDSNRQGEGGAAGKYTGKIINPKSKVNVRVVLDPGVHGWPYHGSYG